MTNFETIAQDIHELADEIKENQERVLTMTEQIEKGTRESVARMLDLLDRKS